MKPGKSARIAEARVGAPKSLLRKWVSEDTNTLKRGHPGDCFRKELMADVIDLQL